VWATVSSDLLSPRHLVSRLAQIALFAGIAALLLVTLPGLGEVRERFGDARAGWVAAALLLEAGSVISFVVVFRGVFCRRLPWGFSAQVGLSEQAANVLLPTGGAGGLALGAWALRRVGMAPGHVARRTVAFFLITSSTNFVVAVVAGLGLATGALGGEAGLALTAVPAGLALAVMAGVALLPRVLPELEHDAAIERRGRFARVRTAGAAVGAGVRDALALLRSGRPAVIGGAAGYMAFDVLALAAAFHAFGHAPATGDFLMAYVLGQLGGLVPLPGGVGGTDGGLVAALALYGTPLATATAAVLAYRAFQLGLPALAGTVAFTQLRRTLAREQADGGPLVAEIVVEPAADAAWRVAA
jgi:uncharacterized membrane protein YbhN (UPF0104 family)